MSLPKLELPGKPFPEPRKDEPLEKLNSRRIKWLRNRLVRVELYLLTLIAFNLNEWLHFAY